MSGLTVTPNDDGTLNITQTGSEQVTLDAGDIDRSGLSPGEKRFLRGQLRYAVPGPVACTVTDSRYGDPPADIAGF